MSAPNAYRAALRGLRPAGWTAFGLSAVLNLLMLTGSLYMLQVYDRVLVSGSVPTLLVLFGIVVVLYGFMALSDAVRARILSRSLMRLERELDPLAFRATIEGRGQPLRDLSTLRQTFSGSLATALMDLPWAPLFLALLFLVHPVLGWLTVGGAALTAMIALLSHRLTRSAIAQTAPLEAAEREMAEGARRGAELVAAMGMGRALTTRWGAARDAALGAEQDATEPGEVLSALSRSLRMLLQSAILTAGAWLVIKGEISAGMIIASSVLSGRALAPIDQVIGGWKGLGRGILAHRSLSKLFGETPQAPARVELPAPRGHVSVKALTRLEAGTGEGRPAILQDVSFALEPGDGLAVIGPSGGGKSTLARLLVGALTPDRGEVRLDGATYAQWEPHELGRFLGYLPQFPSLMSGTVREIIARHDGSVPDEAVIAAATSAGIHELALSLPEGYATRLGGEGGAQLSGGQLQRLGLARALCGRPRLVVLDEPNSNLDAAGDEGLLRAILELRRAGSTVVMVTHRPSALQALNKIALIEGGRVARFGAKEEVLAAMGQPMPPPLRPAPVAGPLAVAPLAAPRPGPQADPASAQAPRMDMRRPSDPRAPGLVAGSEAAQRTAAR